MPTAWNRFKPDTTKRRVHRPLPRSGNSPATDNKSHLNRPAWPVQLSLPYSWYRHTLRQTRPFGQTREDIRAASKSDDVVTRPRNPPRCPPALRAAARTADHLLPHVGRSNPGCKTGHTHGRPALPVGGDQASCTDSAVVVADHNRRSNALARRTKNPKNPNRAAVQRRLADVIVPLPILGPT